MRILGYFVHPEELEINALTAMVVFEYEGNTSKQLGCYTGMEQHSDISNEYFVELIPITKQQYLEANKGYYIPIEYIS